MPRRLRQSARCPKCDSEILAIVDTTHGFKRSRPPEFAVTREYFHEKPAFGRRKRRCVKKFRNYEIAQRERQNLEI